MKFTTNSAKPANTRDSRMFAAFCNKKMTPQYADAFFSTYGEEGFLTCCFYMAASRARTQNYGCIPSEDAVIIGMDALKGYLHNLPSRVGNLKAIIWAKRQISAQFTSSTELWKNRQRYYRFGGVEGCLSLSQPLESTEGGNASVETTREELVSAPQFTPEEEVIMAEAVAIVTRFLRNKKHEELVKFLVGGDWSSCLTAQGKLKFRTAMEQVYGSVGGRQVTEAKADLEQACNMAGITPGNIIRARNVQTPPTKACIGSDYSSR